LYSCPDPNSRVDPQLPPEGTFTLGYGSNGLPPLTFTLEKGQDIDVGFLKVFISTEQMDLSNIKSESPFDNARPVVKRTEGYDLASVWDTILLPVVLRKGP
jgi:hypothetical protein